MSSLLSSTCRRFAPCTRHFSSVAIYEKDQIETLVRGGGDVPYTLIDVREPAELLEDGGIPTSHHIPLGQLPAALRLAPHVFEQEYGFQLPVHDDEALIFYCRSGVRSQQAAEFAVSEGFHNVGNYRGSALEWFCSAQE